jgi:hypothetical protein
MASITLHRADRILLAIKVALKASEPKAQTTLSVFALGIEDEFAKRQEALKASLEDTRRLLAIRAAVKGAQLLGNAQCGVAVLLSRKQAADDLVAVLDRMPGVAPDAEPEPEDPYGMRRRRKKVAPTAIVDVAATVAMAQATRERFKAADGTVASEIETGIVDADMARAFKVQAVKARREADALAEELRALNASTLVDVADEDMNWLITRDVV